eukprot:scaffold30879_cov32-Tisochrysis_lutea.AAC.7
MAARSFRTSRPPSWSWTAPHPCSRFARLVFDSRNRQGTPSTRGWSSGEERIMLPAAWLLLG